MKKALIVIVALLVPLLMSALEPPKPHEIEALKTSGQFEARQEFAKKLGNHIMKFDSRGEKLPGFKGLPTTGNPKIFVLLVEFPDYAHTIEASTIGEMLFGQGNPEHYPYESLKSFYERSSYGKLHIEGDVYGWYKAQNVRDAYTNDAEGLIEEAIAYYHSQGARFDKYDNDGDGEVEYFAVFWTGPDTGWATFWWGWQGTFWDPEYTIDGKRLATMSWQWEEDNPGTVIHETGHALGLPDYYDYDGSVGPDGGMGGMDMMDSVWGDHNGFSKWVLGWLTPRTVISFEELALTPLSTAPSVAVLSRDFDGSDYGKEYFLVQNRSRTANDSDFAGEGYMILHVDARRDCGGYTLFDNSYTEHKLLRVMEADGLEEIERNKWGDEGDFYFSGNNETFSPDSFPNSDLYDGSSSLVAVTGIPEASESMSSRFERRDIPVLSPPSLVHPSVEAPGAGTTPEIKWGEIASASGYELEVREGSNAAYKSGLLPSGTVAHSVPSGKLLNNRVYTIFVKATGDGVSHATSEWEKRVFATSCQDSPFWSTRSFFEPPSYADYAALAYHPGTGVFVRFGGNSCSDVFEYDGIEWKSYISYPAPEDRYFPAMAYDPTTDKILMFGGYDYYEEEVFGDTWLYDPRTHSWQEMSPASSPPANWAFRGVTDIKRKVVVIHAPGETWEWNGTTWKKTASSGPNYYYGNLAYDATGSRVIYFGGLNGSNYSTRNETWSYDGSSWTKLSPPNSPSKRCDSVMSFDGKLRKILLFGGSNEYGDVFNDLWNFDGSTWEKLSYCGRGPTGYYDTLGGYDDKRGRLVLAKAGGDMTTFELVNLGSGGCNPVLEPVSKDFPNEGGSGSVSLTIEESCPWTAGTESSWITVTSPSSGTGPATINYSVSTNTGPQRSGVIEVSGEQFTVTQQTGIVPPSISSVKKMASPFRLKLTGSNFQDGARVYFGEGSGKIEWTNFSRKNSSTLVLKKGASLKALFPKGVGVRITVENPDGGDAYTVYTRP